MLNLSDNTKFVIALVCLAAAFLWPRVKDNIKLPDMPSLGSSVVNIDFEPVNEPSNEMKGYADGIADLVDGEDAKYDKVRLAQFYAQLSHVVRNEPGFIESTGQFRTFNSMSGQINFAGKSLKGKYSGLAKAVDEAIISAIGKENVTLDQSKRDRLADVLAAVSWELWHKE